MKSPAPKKVRLDMLLVERGLYPSREKAAAGLMAGEVWSGETPLAKAGTKVASDLPVEVRSRRTAYVSRAGEKLAHALESLTISAEGRTCLDVGASTGGFTDCLLQRGAERVAAIDVGHGQLDIKLRNDPRVVVLEKTNARTLKLADIQAIEPLFAPPTLLVIDVSFISLRLILPQLLQEFPSLQDWILLFKPQFEVGREFVLKGGIVKDQMEVERALADFNTFMQSHGLKRKVDPLLSPIRGKKSGNQEILLYYALS